MSKKPVFTRPAILDLYQGVLEIDKVKPVNLRISMNSNGSPEMLKLVNDSARRSGVLKRFRNEYTHKGRFVWSIHHRP